MKKINYDREVWEGWTVRDFINEVKMHEQTIAMLIRQGFVDSKKELSLAIIDYQPYYKKKIPEVDAYFQEYFRTLLESGGKGYGWQI